MSTSESSSSSATAAATTTAASAPAAAPAVPAVPAKKTVWKDVVREVAGIANNSAARALAAKHGMSIVSVSWEDTGRASGSSGGPHITDVTIRLADGGPRLPIIRGSSNYTDTTCDIDIKCFSVLVGNEVSRDTAGGPGELRRVSLADFLRDIGRYVPGDVLEPMLAERDTVLLAAPQFCVVPVNVDPVPFFIECYNYQSTPENPAVLYVFASVYGTTVQLVTERGSQRLLVNQHGRVHALQAMRLDDDRKARGKTTTGEMDAEEKTRAIMHLYQIPLVQQEMSRYRSMGSSMFGASSGGGGGGEVNEMCFVPGSASFSFCGAETKEAKKKDIVMEVASTPEAAGEEEEFETEESGGGGGGDEAEGSFPESFVMEDSRLESLVRKKKSKTPRRGMIDAVLSIDPKDRGAFQPVKGVSGMSKFKRNPDFPIRVTPIMWKATDSGVMASEPLFVEMGQRMKDYARMSVATGSLVTDDGAELRATATFATKSDLLAPLAAAVIAGPAPASVAAPSSSSPSAAAPSDLVLESMPTSTAPKPGASKPPSKSSVVMEPEA